MGDKYLRMPGARFAGQFQGPVPKLVAAGWRWAQAGYSKTRTLCSLALCRPPGTEGGEKESWGVWARPGALVSVRRGKGAPEQRQLHGGRAQPHPRLFPTPTSPGRRRRPWAPRDPSERPTAEEELVPSFRRS